MENILITSFPLESNYGGGEKMDLLLASMLRNNGLDVFFWGSCPVLLREFRKEGFDVDEAFFVKDLTSIKSIILSPFYIFSLLIQSVFVLPKLRLQGVRKIIMLSLIEQMFLSLPAKLLGYDIYWWHHVPPKRSMLKNPFFTIWKLCSNFVTLIVSSQFMEDVFVNLGLKHVEILPNAVSFSSKNVYKSEEVVKGGRLKVGMVCRLSPEKGIFDFIRLAKDFPQYDFLIAGEGSLRSEIETYVEKNKLKNFQLLGFISPEKISDYFSSLDIFCVLSEYESFGIVAAEASLVGVPVIASNVAALPEVIINEETGLLFEYGDYEDLKNKLNRLANDTKTRNAFGNNGRKYVSSRFLPEHFFKKACDILKIE